MGEMATVHQFNSLIDVALRGMLICLTIKLSAIKHVPKNSCAQIERSEAAKFEEGGLDF